MKIALFALLFICVSAHCQVVDTGYGTGGTLYVDIPPSENREYNRKTFYTSDRKTVNFGRYDTGSYTTQTYFIAKHNFDGTPDNSFGPNGLLNIPNYPNNTGTINVSGIVMLDDDSLILSCYANTISYLVKITGNGSIDTSFGINGFMIVDFLSTPTTATYGELMKDGQGQIFIVYESSTPGSPAKRYTNLCKILPNGIIDRDFGNNGFSSILINRDYNFQTLKKKVVKAGKIYHFGTLSYSVNGNTTQTDVWTCHWLNGTPDTGFGDNGYIYAPRDITINDYNIQEDGKVLIAKYVDVSPAFHYMRASRYLHSGAIDTSFGDGGKVESSYGQWTMHVPYKIMELSDHGIYVFSSYYKSLSPIEYSATILKYDVNGVRDATFGVNGMFKIPANITNVTDVLENADDSLIISFQNNAWGSLFNMKVNHTTDVLETGVGIIAPQTTLYPNPVEDVLYISGMKNGKFAIYNSVGQKTKEGSYISGKGIQVQDLSKGTYWLRLDDSETIMFIKR